MLDMEILKQNGYVIDWYQMITTFITIKCHNQNIHYILNVIVKSIDIICKMKPLVKHHQSYQIFLIQNCDSELTFVIKV